MEQITYQRSDNGFITKCKYKKGKFVGSHDCFFCYYCKGRTAEEVSCIYQKLNPQTKEERSIAYISFDVMVKGSFRKTIRIVPNFEYIKGKVFDLLPKGIIDKVVREQCPASYNENWNVELNYIKTTDGIIRKF